MTNTQFERQFAQWLHSTPAATPSTRLLAAATQHARTHPRRGWLVRLRGLSGAAEALLRPAPVALRPIVLLALLALTFALGAFFYAASHNNAVVPQPSPTTLPSPGPAGYVCPLGSDPNIPGPADQERPWAASSQNGGGPIAFDSKRGHVLVVAGSPSSLWTFDVCSNTWAKSDLDLRPAGSTAFSFLVYDPASDTLFTDEVEGTQLGAFHLDTGTHTRLAQAPFAGSRAEPWPPFSRAVLRTSADQLIVRDQVASRLEAYDIGSGAWTELEQLGDVPPALGLATLIAYDASVDRLVMYSANSGFPPAEKWTPRTYEYDFATATWARTGDAPDLNPPYGVLGGYQMTYDAAWQRTVVFNSYGGIAYDATTHTWQHLVMGPYLTGDLASIWNSIGYDSTNHRIVVVGPETDGVFAIDTVSTGERTWHVLLAPNTP